MKSILLIISCALSQINASDTIQQKDNNTILLQQHAILIWYIEKNDTYTFNSMTTTLTTRPIIIRYVQGQTHAYIPVDNSQQEYSEYFNIYDLYPRYTYYDAWGQKTQVMYSSKLIGIIFVNWPVEQTKTGAEHP